MKGYKRLFKLDLSSKTIENSYKVLNRQIWTNQKEFWKTSAIEESSNQCTLCGGVQNTMHLLFECPEYSELAWEGLKEAFVEMYSRLDGVRG